MSQVIKSGVPINKTSSAAISVSGGSLLGWYVNNTTNGTIIICNGSTSAGTAVSGTITPAIGWHRFPAYLPSGCYATIGGAALDVTFIFAAG